MKTYFALLPSAVTRPRKMVDTEKDGNVKCIKLPNYIIIQCLSCIVLRCKGCYIIRETLGAFSSSVPLPERTFWSFVFGVLR